MATKGVVAPRLPLAPVEYDQRFMDALLGILRQYFNALDNPGPVLAATERTTNPTEVISALSCAKPDINGSPTVSLPTQADLANLRKGDVYYDTTAGNVLKIKV
jgi:hypothetical protein